MAENITFDINAKDNASASLQKVSNNLTKMQKNVQATTSTFEKFRNALVGLGTVSFVASTLRWADSIQDLSDATGIATQNILGFSLAVQQNGGTFESAGQAINKFVLSIAEAADGSAATQAAFAEVGVSLEDLRTLSEQDLLQKTIQGLSQISDVATRAAIQNELLGKSLRGVNIQGVAGSLGAATTESAKYAQSIKNAADVQQKLESSISNLRIALLDVVGPIATVAKEFSANIETIKTFIKTALTIGAVIASFTLAGKVIGGIVRLFQILSSATISLSQATLGVGLVFQQFLSKLSGGVIGLLNFAGRLLGIASAVDKVGKFLKPLIAVIAGAITGFKLFGDNAKQAGDKAADGMDAAAEAEKKLKAEADKRAVIDANKKFVESIREIGKAYKEANLERLQSLGSDIKYLSMTEEQIALDKNRIVLHKEMINTLDELAKKRAEALADPTKGKKEIDAIDAEIKKVQELGVTTQTESVKKIKAYFAEIAALKDVQNGIEDVGRAFAQGEALQGLQDELSLIGLTGDELERRRTILAAEKALREEMQRLSVTLLQLEADRARIGEVAYNKEKQRITQQMSDAQALADAKIKAFEEQKKRESEIEQSYTEGAKRALEDIAEQYKPINMAQEAVRKGWDTIGSAIDNMVETGKFKFSDFARSVILDLTKMIAKAMIFKAISSVLGAFGLKIPGLAEGGPAKGGQPYIVGEKGPELFVPQGSGKIIPNNQLGSGQGSMSSSNAPINNTYITNNINAIDARSVAQLFAENRKTLLGSVIMAQKEMPYATNMV